MKFIVDEQLPGSLVKWLCEQNIDAIHATSLGTGDKISDLEICKKSILEERVVISKDIDFLNRFLLKNEPWKLIYVTTGNISNRDLLSLFQNNFKQLSKMLEHSAVIELNRHNLLIRI